MFRDPVPLLRARAARLVSGDPPMDGVAFRDVTGPALAGLLAQVERLLEDPDLSVRFAAIQALARHRPALDALERLSRHPVCGLRRAATWAIEEIKGKPHVLDVCSGYLEDY